MVSLIRCDDRMMHGQCIIGIIKDYQIERIIGVDDFTANNSALKAIYEEATPQYVDGGVYSEEGALHEIAKCKGGYENTLILVKSPQTALRLYLEADDLPKELNIGPMSSRKNTRKATKYAYLSDEEIMSIEQMSQMGVRVYFNQAPGEGTDEWLSIREKLKDSIT